MARLPRGWSKLKVVGEVEPVQILINRDSGKFGTLIAKEDAKIEEHSTLANAEARVKAINAEGAIDALITEYQSSYGIPEIVRLRKVRVRKIGNVWSFSDGSRVGGMTLYTPDATALELIEDKRLEHSMLLQKADRLRDECWDLVRSMKILND